MGPGYALCTRSYTCPSRTSVRLQGNPQTGLRLPPPFCYPYRCTPSDEAATGELPLVGPKELS